MGRLSSFLSDWTQPILGGKPYKQWEEESLKLQQVAIKNRNLAHELEEECYKKDGFLTYAEFLQVEQFGEYGYHATHNKHGFTYTYKDWPKAILEYIKQHNITDIIEIGPGNGILAKKVFSLAAKEDIKFTWNFVEVSALFRAAIKYHLKDKKFQKFLGEIVETIDDLPSLESALIISSYCIDSTPPLMITNTKTAPDTPNACVGIKIQNGIVSEFLLNKEELKKKHIYFENESITVNGTTFDLSTWKLSPMQRAYIIFDGFQMLLELSQKIKRPHFLIIEEIRDETSTFRSDHILSPLLLSIKNRRHFSPRTGYIRAGEILYYYPFYLSSLTSLLKSIGMDTIEADIEERMAAKLTHTTWKQNPKYRYLCYAIIASGTSRKASRISLQFPEIKSISASKL